MEQNTPLAAISGRVILDAGRALAPSYMRRVVDDEALATFLGGSDDADYGRVCEAFLRTLAQRPDFSTRHDAALRIAALRRVHGEIAAHLVDADVLARDLAEGGVIARDLARAPMVYLYCRVRFATDFGMRHLEAVLRAESEGGESFCAEHSPLLLLRAAAARAAAPLDDAVANELACDRFCLDHDALVDPIWRTNAGSPRRTGAFYLHIGAAP